MSNTYQIILLGNGEELFLKPKELDDLNKILISVGAKPYDTQGETRLTKEAARKNNLRFSTIVGILNDKWGHTYTKENQVTLGEFFDNIIAARPYENKGQNKPTL